MVEQYLSNVHQVAEQHGAVPLLVCLCGSRAFGYAAPHSDYDVRFVYAYPLSRYFTLTPAPQELRLREADVVGYELGKFLAMCAGNGWNAHEILHSPVLYERADVVAELRGLAASVFSPPEIVAALLSGVKTYQRRMAHIDGADPDATDKRVKWTLGCLHHGLAARYVAEHGEAYPIPIAELASAVLPHILPQVERLVAWRAGQLVLSNELLAHCIVAVQQVSAELSDSVQLAVLPPAPVADAAPLESFYLKVANML